MADRRVGRRFKEARENLGMTQHQLARMLGKGSNYIATIERGASFPEYDNLVRLLNILKASPDVILCDVLDHVTIQRASQLSERLEKLPAREQKRILETLEFLIQQAEEAD